ncbi:major facilitator superfamily transporter [Colletotrichum abscissum]|uniref:Major facilitator superfamily transporter n=1 Tax=Colletotrichum abscissum TaxID=1671311 RepID=A0A9P9XI74_9PEZI|nr:major facilitator superfamily transporter [Colletotrichum abscissum]KAI3554146.1 major facilitator superfamily transporter [Colletotrichum abscissum]KAK1507363.1 major facilitator superfamily transporter [Colletotrichum abscissum]
MAESSRLQTPSRSNRSGEASPSFAQTTAEFSLDSDLDFDPDDDDDDVEDLHLHEAQLGGGQAYELKSLSASPAKDTDDGWGDEVPSLRRRASTSTVASFQLYTPDEERSVVRKHDRKLVVFVALLFMLSFLDRSNIGNARIAGMDEDLQTNPPWDGWYEWTLTAFYISYIFFEWMSLLWKLIPAHIYVSMIVLSWGLTASLQSVSVSYPTLIFLRVLLGIGEAGFTGIPFYLSFFFKREELAFRTAIFISAAPLATTFASSLAWLITNYAEAGPIAPWRLLFLVEGFPSVLAAVAAWHIIPDSPDTARYLTAREQKVARLRLRREKPRQKKHGGKGHSNLNLGEAFAVLCDPMALLTAAMFFLTNMAYSSLPVFLPKILTEMGHSRLASQGLSAPPYFLAFLAVLFTAHLSDRAQTRSIPIILHALASAGGYAALALAKPIGLSPLLRYLAVYPAAIGFFNVVTLTVAWSINNQASESRQGGGFALMQIIGQCGPLVGTRLYPDRDAPFYAPGMQTCAGAMLAVAVLALSLRFYLSYLNRKTDVACAVGSETEEEEGLVGSGGRKRTASEGFRYML